MNDNHVPDWDDLLGIAALAVLPYTALIFAFLLE
jgi:hypothetical protein